MKTSVPTLDHLIDTLGGCLNEESARRLLALKPDRAMQARLDALSRKSDAGTLTDDEREEYRRTVTFGTFVSMLKSKARTMVAEPRNG